MTILLEAIATLAEELERASRQPTRLLVTQELRSLLPPPTERLAEPNVHSEAYVRLAASWAFAYQLVESENGKSRRVSFGPCFETSTGEQVPPPLTDLPAETVDVWEGLADRLTAPFAVARMQHLLFECRRGNRHDRARLAAQAYLTAGDLWNEDLDRANDLNFALRLARAVRLEDLAEEVMAYQLQQALSALEVEALKPGVFLKYVEPLVHESRPPTELDALLLQGAKAFQSDWWTLESIHDLRLIRASDETERAGVQDDIVTVWIDAGEQATGIPRAAHLSKALERATKFNRTDLKARAAEALQRISLDELNLKSISVTSYMNPSQAEQAIAPIVEQADWRRSLARFAIYGPVIGTLDDNRAELAKQQKEFVFSNLPRRQVVGGDGLPRFTAQTEQQQAEMALSQYETTKLQITAPLLSRALHGIVARHGLPDLEELIEYFITYPQIDAQMAAALARTLIRYWTGDYEGAAFTAAPRIETLTRQLVVALGVGVYRAQRVNTPGQYPGLGALLTLLVDKHGMDESWHRMILTLCANPAGGFNLRNEIAHGFVCDVSASTAAALVQALLYLAMLRPIEPSEQAVSDTQLSKGDGNTDLKTQEIGDLLLPVRATRSLQRAGIVTVAKLTQLTERDLLELRDIGPATVDDLKQKLAARGLALSTSDDDPPASETHDADAD